MGISCNKDGDVRGTFWKERQEKPRSCLVGASSIFFHQVQIPKQHISSYFFGSILQKETTRAPGVDGKSYQNCFNPLKVS